MDECPPVSLVSGYPLFGFLYRCFVAALSRTFALPVMSVLDWGTSHGQAPQFVAAELCVWFFWFIFFHQRPPNRHSFRLVESVVRLTLKFSMVRRGTWMLRHPAALQSQMSTLIRNSLPRRLPMIFFFFLRLRFPFSHYSHVASGSVTSYLHRAW